MYSKNETVFEARNETGIGHWDCCTRAGVCRCECSAPWNHTHSHTETSIGQSSGQAAATLTGDWDVDSDSNCNFATDFVSNLLGRLCCCATATAAVAALLPTVLHTHTHTHTLRSPSRDQNRWFCNCCLCCCCSCSCCCCCVACFVVASVFSLRFVSLLLLFLLYFSIWTHNFYAFIAASAATRCCFCFVVVGQAKQPGDKS